MMHMHMHWLGHLNITTKSSLCIAYKHKAWLSLIGRIQHAYAAKVHMLMGGRFTSALLRPRRQLHVE